MTPKTRNAAAPPRVTENVMVSFVLKQNKRIIWIHTNTHADPASDGPTTNYGGGCADSMTGTGSDGHPPVVLSGCHGDRGDLAAVTPFTEESHSKGLHPRGAEKQREEVVQARNEIVESLTGSRRRATGR